MDYSKDEARKAKEIAEKKFHDQDLEGARKMALKAHNMYPLLEGLTQFIAVLNVHLAASSGQKTKGLVDYYKVLDVDTDAQVSVIRKQFRKLALLLHPDKNYGVGAEGAFKLVAEAWGNLSDETKKALYDKKRTEILRRSLKGEGSSSNEFHNQGFSNASGTGNKRKNNGADDDNDDNDEDDCVILENGFGRWFGENRVKTQNANRSTGKVNTDKKEEMVAVPDSDFYDFDGDRAEESFEVNQIWAAYDDEDGMPRFYARIRKISSLHPFKVQITWLESLLNNEPALIKWYKAGFYKGCGDFKSLNSIAINSVNVFSHIVGWEISKGGVKIMPRRGDVWALYRDWSPDWDASTPEEVRHKYLLVEILSDSVNGVGIDVVPLVKVGKYRTLFQRMKIEGATEKNMLRFSHKVPAHRLKGNAALNIPRDCWELDPAALPADMVQEGAP